MSQTMQVLAYLKTGKSLTPLQALRRWGIFRLAARVCDLRDGGYDVRCSIVRRGGKRYAEYRL